MKLHKALQYQKKLNSGWSKKAKRKTNKRFNKKVKIWFKILGKFLGRNYEGFEKTLPLIEKHYYVIRALRNQLRYEDHFFSGEAIYEDCKTKDDFKFKMDCISDRWGDHYRLSWMLALPEKYKNAP